MNGMKYLVNGMFFLVNEFFVLIAQLVTIVTSLVAQNNELYQNWFKLEKFLKTRSTNLV
jgi:hypothetical protein